ncbi:MAG: GreA/GreB family elongation factor [Ilumatobacteraceae bacterium]
MTRPLDERIWLTPTAYAGFTAELDQLTRSTTAPAPEVEARIRDLTSLLRHAEVGDKPDDGLVEPGMTITATFEGEAEPTVFLLAHRGIADTDPHIDTDVYTPASPLGASIIGKFPGDPFRYETPSGVKVSGRIVSAEPFRSATAGSATGR